MKANAESVVSTPTLVLSEYIARAMRMPLPADVLERAKIHVVDTFAAMISGSHLLPGRRASAYVKALGGVREATVVGTRIVTSPVNAALANGMFAHADETDDTHPPSRTHPGAAVIPAAYAVGERVAASGQATLRAIVLGYEVCARMMLAIDELYLRGTGHFASSFGGIFGAAAAAAGLLKLDARRVRYALSHAAQQASGLYCVLRDTEHIQKAFAGGGMAPQDGVAAALMAAHGFSAVEDVFAGERNFFFTFAPEADLTKLTRDLGKRHEIMYGGIKRWPAGGPIQGPLHVLRAIMEKHRFTAADVESLTAHMPANELNTVNNRSMPDICVQHLLAIMLLDRGITFKSAHDHKRMQDRKVLALRKRITAVGDAKLTDVLRRWRCVMEIKLKDGRILRDQTMAAKGTSEDPMTREEEHEKALDLIVPVLGERRCKKLLATLWGLEKLSDLQDLRRLVTV